MHRLDLYSLGLFFHYFRETEGGGAGGGESEAASLAGRCYERVGRAKP